MVTNTEKVIDKLNDPDPIINTAYWIEIKDILVVELEKRKVYNAKRAIELKPDRVASDELPSKDEVKQFNRYQHHLTEANLNHIIIYFLEVLFEELVFLISDFSIEKHERFKADATLQEMLLELDKQHKTSIFWYETFLSESAIHSDFINLSIELATKLKSQSHDNKNKN